MSYEQKEGDISIFKNDKRTSDNQPTMRGTMVWKGEKIKISLWTKGEGDRKFLAGKVEADNYQKPEPSAPAPIEAPDFESEPIPF